jgi:hypothetical protein
MMTHDSYYLLRFANLPIGNALLGPAPPPLTSFMLRSIMLDYVEQGHEVRLSVVMGLRQGLRLIRGMRRALTEEEQHKVARKIVEHLESTNWKIEKGPPAEGHGQHFGPR